MAKHSSTAYGISAVMGLPPEDGLDAVPVLLETVCKLTGMSCANVAKVAAESWMSVATRDMGGFNIPTGVEIPRQTICHDSKEQRRTLYVQDAREDATYANNAAMKELGLRSIITAPIILETGEVFGTLCSYDREPKLIPEPSLDTFSLLAKLLAKQIDDARRVTRMETTLRQEVAAGDLREQFIAILSHDLRNPIAAIMGATQMLHKDEQARARFVPLIDRSARRMLELVNNLTDMTRLRLGSGIEIMRQDVHLAEAMTHLVEEARSANPGRVVEYRLHLPNPIYCDAPRISQLLSNLLGNAVSHGNPAFPIVVEAHVDEINLQITVANGGDPISPEVMGRLFKPYSRGGGGGNKQGLGLGLFIASEIARAHGGVLSVTSTNDQTRFTFNMPLHECGLATAPIDTQMELTES